MLVETSPEGWGRAEPEEPRERGQEGSRPTPPGPISLAVAVGPADEAKPAAPSSAAPDRPRRQLALRDQRRARERRQRHLLRERDPLARGRREADRHPAQDARPVVADAVGEPAPPDRHREHRRPARAGDPARPVGLVPPEGLSACRPASSSFSRRSSRSSSRSSLSSSARCPRPPTGSGRASSTGTCPRTGSTQLTLTREGETLEFQRNGDGALAHGQAGSVSGGCVRGQRPRVRARRPEARRQRLGRGEARGLRPRQAGREGDARLDRGGRRRRRSRRGRSSSAARDAGHRHDGRPGGGPDRVLFVPSSVLDGCPQTGRRVPEPRALRRLRPRRCPASEISRGQGSLVLARREGVWWISQPFADLADAVRGRPSRRTS